MVVILQASAGTGCLWNPLDNSFTRLQSPDSTQQKNSLCLHPISWSHSVQCFQAFAVLKLLDFQRLTAAVNAIQQLHNKGFRWTFESVLFMHLDCNRIQPVPTRQLSSSSQFNRTTISSLGTVHQLTDRLRHTARLTSKPIDFIIQLIPPTNRSTIHDRLRHSARIANRFTAHDGPVPTWPAADHDLQAPRPCGPDESSSGLPTMESADRWLRENRRAGHLLRCDFWAKEVALSWQECRSRGP